MEDQTRATKRKVAINPCAGVGKLMGGICRQAAYKVVDELKPGVTELVCMPALAAGIQEDIDFIKDYPVVVINGCSLKCGTKVVVDQGGVVSREIYAPRVVAGKVNLKNESRSEHGPAARLAANLIAQLVADEVDALLEGPESATA